MKEKLKLLLLCCCMLLPTPIAAQEDTDELEYAADLYEGSLIVINDKDGNEWQRVVVNDNLTVDITYPVYEGWEFDYWKDEWTPEGVLVLTPVYREKQIVQTDDDKKPVVEEAPLPEETVEPTPVMTVETIKNEPMETSDSSEENIKTKESDGSDYFIYGLVATVTIVGAGAIFFVFKKK